MKIIACLRIATFFLSNIVCWAQIAIVDQGISSAIEGIVGSYINQASQTIYTAVELPSNIASSVDVASTTGIASDSSVSNAISTTPPASTSTITSMATSPTSVTTTSPPSTATSIANTPSATPSPGLSPSAKIGIGVGVPLGVIIGLAIIGFLVQRYQRHKKISRLGHHGILAAAGLYPVIDETDDVGEKDEIDRVDVEDSSGLRALERNGVHELHGIDIPACSRELPGSPGVPRHDVRTWRGSE